MGLLLDPLDGGALGADHQTNHTIGHTHLGRGLTGLVGDQLSEGQGGVDVVLGSGGPDLGEVLSGGKDLALGQGDILFPAGDHEDGLLPANRCLDVGVRLGAECLDFAA